MVPNTGHQFAIKKIAVMVAKPLQMVWPPLLRLFVIPNTPLKIFLKNGKYF